HLRPIDAAGLQHSDDELGALLESGRFLLREIYLQLLALLADGGHLRLDLAAPRAQAFLRLPQVIRAPSEPTEEQQTHRAQRRRAGQESPVADQWIGRKIQANIHGAIS